MPCNGCEAYTMIQLGWMPVNGQGNPQGSVNSQFLTSWPSDAMGGDWTLGVAFFRPSNSPAIPGAPHVGVIPFGQLASVGSLYNEDGEGNFAFQGGASQQDFENMGVMAVAPGAGQDDNTGENGECQPDANPPGCEEKDPCTGSVKYRLSLANAEVDRWFYATTCVGGGTGPVTPQGSPADYGNGGAAPAGTSPNPQKPIGFGPGGDRTKVAIEAAYPGCYCNRLVTVSLRTPDGDPMEVTDTGSGQKYRFSITVWAICSVCRWTSPPGVCCYEDANDEYCYKADLDENECEEHTPEGGVYLGYSEEGPDGCSEHGGENYEECEELQ